MNDAMNTFPSNDNLDLPELEENPHWRAQTSGTTGMTTDTMNAFLMRREPPQERTNLRNKQDDEYVLRQDDDNPDFPELEENPHMRAQTSRTPPTCSPTPLCKYYLVFYSNFLTIYLVWAATIWGSSSAILPPLISFLLFFIYF